LGFEIWLDVEEVEAEFRSCGWEWRWNEERVWVGGFGGNEGWADGVTVEVDAEAEAEAEDEGMEEEEDSI
jgi:hypothetical protein